MKKLLFGICLTLQFMFFSIVQAEDSNAVRIAEAASLASQDQRPMQERLAALRSILDSESLSDRTIALKSVAQNAEENIAVIAARSLIQSGTPESTDILASRITQWSPNNQLVVLSSLFQNAAILTREPQLAALPRSILDVWKQGAPQDQIEPPNTMRRIGSSLDQAAILLSTISHKTEDASLIQVSLKNNPRSVGIWLARSQGTPLSEAEVTLAKGFYSESKQDRLLAMAAAIAAVPYDSVAENFVRNTFNELFIEIESIKTPTLATSTGPAETLSYLHFYESLRFVGMLRFLSAPVAKELTFKFAGARNKDVATIAFLIAAYRWPNELIESSKDFSEKDTLVPFLAYAVSTHPQLKEDALKQISEDKLKKGSDDIQSRGGVLASPLIGFLAPPGWNYLLSSN